MRRSLQTIMCLDELVCEGHVRPPDCACGLTAGKRTPEPAKLTQSPFYPLEIGARGQIQIPLRTSSCLARFGARSTYDFEASTTTEPRTRSSWFRFRR
jgi:hypothetical protein